MQGASDRFGLVGTIVADKYRVERVVGEGGFGVVYRAQHQIWDQPVALKCFTALSNAPQEMRGSLLDLFVQEGKLLSALSSRTAAIVQARDIGTLTTPGGTWLPYMVLEWLDGVSLDRLIKGKDGEDGPRRPLAEVFQLLDGAARALALAHSHGVAHRDIKPENFFVIGGQLAPGVVIKVLDFGIAKVMQSQARTAMAATGTNISSFTPAYGAPEQFDRVHGATGPWTDVFQMALIVLEMVRGRPPFEGDTFLQLAYASQNPDRRPTPRALGLEVPPAVEEVFGRALAVRVVDRFANMGSFWNALGEALGIRDMTPLPTERVAEVGSSELAGGASSALSTHQVATVTRPGQAPGTGPVSQTGGTIVAPGSLAPGSMGPASAHGRTLPMSASATEVPGAAQGSTPAPARSPWPLVMGIGALAVTGVVAFLVAGGGGAEPPRPIEPAKAVAPPEPVKEVPAEPPAPVAPPAPCPEGMALVPGGLYYQGTDEAAAIFTPARPAHQVEVAPFCMDVTEVTVDAYRACSKTGTCKRAFRDSYWTRGKSMTKAEWEKSREAHSPLCNENVDDRGAHPINCVTWEQARFYCESVGKRLPTEAEWEYAARGSDQRTFPWGDEEPTARHLNACGPECIEWRVNAGIDPGKTLYVENDGHPATAPVGSFPAGKTQAGLLDMIGNVFEWTADPFAPYPGSETATPEGENRVIRGGAFNSTEIEFTNPALRYAASVDTHSHGIGFRCATEPKPAAG